MTAPYPNMHQLWWYRIHFLEGNKEPKLLWCYCESNLCNVTFELRYTWVGLSYAYMETQTCCCVVTTLAPYILESAIATFYLFISRRNHCCGIFNIQLCRSSPLHNHMTDLYRLRDVRHIQACVPLWKRLRQGMAVSRQWRIRSRGWGQGIGMRHATDGLMEKRRGKGVK